VIDTASDTITATIPVSERTIGAVVSPDGTRVYVTNYNDGTVAVINTADNAVRRHDSRRSHSADRSGQPGRNARLRHQPGTLAPCR